MDRVNTASIVESCQALPGVSVEDREDGASLRLANPEGRGRMDFYPLFPGLTLARIAVEAPSWPAPQPGPCTTGSPGPPPHQLLPPGPPQADPERPPPRLPDGGAGIPDGALRPEGVPLPRTAL